MTECREEISKQPELIHAPDPGPGWTSLEPDEPVDELDQCYFFDNGWVGIPKTCQSTAAKDCGACVRRYNASPPALSNYAGGPLKPLLNAELLMADDVMWYRDKWQKVPNSRVGQSALNYAQFCARLADTVPKPTPRTRDEHIAEFWISFAKAVGDVGGSLAFCKPATTAVQMADVLAQNGIRIVYDPSTMGK